MLSGAQSAAAEDDDDVVLVTAPAAKQRAAAAKPGVANAGKRQRDLAADESSDAKRKKLIPASDNVISLD